MSPSIEPCYWLGNSSSCAQQLGAVTDMWTEPCDGCNHDGTRTVGWPPTEGILATKCHHCDGAGQTVTGEGYRRQWWDCHKCRTTGWIVHDEIKAVAEGEVTHGGCGLDLCPECKAEEPS